MGFKDFFSDKSKSEVKLDPRTTEARKWILGLLQQPAPDFPTLGTAGMSPAEQTGQNLLGQYIGSPANTGDYDLALNEFRKTLAGDYDPVTGAAYQGYRDASMMEEEGAVNKVAGRAQKSGTYGFTGALTGEGMTRRGYSADRMARLGALQESERNRQMAAAGMLPEAADYASADPLRKAAAGMQLGGLPRELEQQGNVATYNQIMQQLMFPYTTQANLAQVLATLQPIGSTTTNIPSDFKIAGGIAGLIGGMM